MSEERQNNAVFTQQHAEAMKAAGVAVQQLSGDVPVERIPLPSNGTVYSEASPLFNVDGIDVKAMTAREEDILTSKALIKNGTVITELIKSCIVDKRIDVRQMLAGDRNALMVGIRITGYGADYEVEVECAECGQRQEATFDLGALKLKRLNINPVTPGQNVFEFALPVSKKRIAFKFITGADEEEISRILDKRKDLGTAIDPTVTTRLRFCIVSVDGNTDGAQISRFVSSMLARDSRALRAYIDNNEPGIEMKGEFRCKHCAFEEEVPMPLGAGFFWPKS